MTLRRMLASPWLPAVGALAALALAVVAANDSARRVEARLDTARQETSHLVLLRELRTALVNAETAQRGYLLTREDSFLEPYRLSLDAARVALSRVDALARDEPDTAPAIETLKAEVAVAVTELSETVDLAQEGRRDEAARRIRTGEGKVAMDRMRADVTALVARHEAAIAAVSMDVDAQFGRTRTWLTVATGLAACLLVLGVLLATRQRRSELRAARAQVGELESRNAALERLDDAFVRALGEATFHMDLASGRGSLRGDVARIAGDSAPRSAAEFEARIHPEDRGAVRRRFRRAIVDGGRYDSEFRFRHSSDGWRWLQTRGAGVRDGRGRTTAVVGVLRDVTAERELVLSRAALAARLDSTLEYISDGFALFDRELRYLRVNAQAERWLRAGRDSLLGRSLAEPFGVDASNPFLAGCRRALADGVTVHVFNHFPAWDRWFDSRIHPVPEGLAVFFRDVTEQQRIGNERERLSRRLRDLLESIRDGFVGMDRELRYTYVNPTAERLMGHPAEQLLGRGLLEVFPEVRELEVHRACVRVLASGTPEANEQFFPRQQRWYRNHLYPTSDGLAVFFEDITAAKRMEALLGEERMRYRAVFEQAGAGVVERRLDDGRVLAANARYLQILGRTEAEVIGSPLGAFAHPDDRAGEQRRFAALRAGAENVAPTEKRFLRPDGSVVWISLTSSVVRPGGNRPPYLITILQDVTERQRAADALARSEQRLATYSRELARAVEAERTRIAREIHDELGQLLTGLKLDVAWLARRLPPATSTTGTGTSAVAERIEDIQVQLDETIHSMRRIATELRPAALDELGLGPALRAHVAEFVRRAGLSADIRIDDVDVGADGATALFRIAQEALTNVARHASASHVQVTLAAEAGHAMLEVADDGRGAPLEAGGETAAERIGHGLVGIFERARLAGGEASVVSGPGHGTAVRARVPRAAPRRDPELEQRA